MKKDANAAISDWVNCMNNHVVKDEKTTSHLAVKEIIEFVSFDKLFDDTEVLSSKVNEYLRSCAGCLEKVSLFQIVYDELCRIGNVADIKQSIYSLIGEDKIQQCKKVNLAKEFNLRNNTK